MSEPQYDWKYSFPNCMHVMAAAMHIHRINPSSVEIVLPFDDWWKLHCALEAQFRGMMTFDGRGALANQFQFMGFVFMARA